MNMKKYNRMRRRLWKNVLAVGTIRALIAALLIDRNLKRKPETHATGHYRASARDASHSGNNADVHAKNNAKCAGSLTLCAVATVMRNAVRDEVGANVDYGVNVYLGQCCLWC